MNKDIQGSSNCLPNTSPGSKMNIQKTLKELIAEKRSQAYKLQQENSDIRMTDPYETINKYVCLGDKGTGIVAVESRDHFCLWDNKYPELPARVSKSWERLESLHLLEQCELIKPDTFSEDIFLTKHTPQLWKYLKDSKFIPDDKLEQYSSRWDSVYFTQDTYSAAKQAAEAVITLTLKVAEGYFKNGFALIRPPGHHCMTDAFCGYCFLNNVAIAADVAISRNLAKKILIVDYDVHHGQGTQRMFYDRDDVLYFSIHRYEHGEFWPNLRESNSDYIGVGKGTGYTVNVPLNKTGMGDSEYLAIILNLLLPIAYEFNPDLILISAGYDAAVGCPEGQMNVSPHFYGHLIGLLSGLADSKIVVCLEGGYFLESLAEGVACTLKALLGYICHPIDLGPNPLIDQSVQEVINNVKYFLREYWECFRYEETFVYPKQGALEDRLNFDNQNDHVTFLDFILVPLILPYETKGFYPVRSEDEMKMYRDIVENLRKEYTNEREFVKPIGYIYDEELLHHKPTKDSGKNPPEKPERLIEIMRSFEKFGLKERCLVIKQSEFDVNAWLLKVHENEYLKQIFTQENLVEKPDWYHNIHTGKCIKKCIASILSLAESIHNSAIRAGIAIIRPPGHHAARSSGSGFCFANNAVVAAEYLVKEKKYKRVLIIDFDIHHGDGTQNLTYNRSDIMYISVHRFDNAKFFPSNPSADYMFTGEYPGQGYNVNIPFNKGKRTDIDYWMIWHRLVLPIAYSYNPEFVIISAGFDAGIYDPLGGGYKVTPEMFGHLIYTAKHLASGKILLTLEGGYHLETTALSMTMCMKALIGDPLPVPKFSEKINDNTMETIKNVVEVHRSKWPALELNKRIANFSCMYEQRRKMEEIISNRAGDHNAVEELEKFVEKCSKNSSY